MLSFIHKHRVGVGAGTLVLAAGLAWLAFGFFGIHTLFVDDVVDEAGPVFDTAGDTGDTGSGSGSAEVADTGLGTRPESPAATPDTDTEATAAPAGTTSDAPPPETVTPTAPVTPTEPPDLRVAEIVTEYLGTFESDAHPTSGDAVVLGNGTGQRFLRFENFATDNGPDLNVYLVNSSTGDVSDYVDLGDLTGNIGDQNYEIPADVDLSVYDEVVIWCVRFGVGFGDARLAPV